jgi:hypothetical protein
MAILGFSKPKKESLSVIVSYRLIGFRGLVVFHVAYYVALFGLKRMPGSRIQSQSVRKQPLIETNQTVLIQKEKELSP